MGHIHGRQQRPRYHHDVSVTLEAVLDRVGVIQSVTLSVDDRHNGRMTLHRFEDPQIAVSYSVLNEAAAGWVLMLDGNLRRPE